MNQKLAGLVVWFTILGTAIVAAPTAARSLPDQVRHELLMLPYIGVFDTLSYAVDQNGVVKLTGEVVQPIDRYNAEQAVKSLPGVTKVDNQIEVLPLSPFDNQIRLSTLRALERTGSLGKYFTGVHPAIRIIVKNGHVNLEGEVLNEGDRIMAYMAANRVPNVFSVSNDLQVEVK